MTLTTSLMENVIKSIRYVLRRGVKDDPEARLHDLDSESLSWPNSLGTGPIVRHSRSVSSTSREEPEQTIFIVPTSHTSKSAGFCDVPDELLNTDTRSYRRRESSVSSKAWTMIPEVDELVTPTLTNS